MTEQSEATPTLEELASSIRVEQTPPAQSEKPVIPQFESSEDATKWAVQETGTLKQSVESLTSELRAEKERSYIDGRWKALDNAVSDISKEVPISKMMIEGVFHTKYSRDAAFQKIFDNREANPEAFKKALGVLKEEIKREAAYKHDPEAEENSRALRQLQKSSRSPAKPDVNEKFRNMNSAEFENEWRKLING